MPILRGGRDGRRVAYASGAVNATVDLFVAVAGQQAQKVHTDKGGTALDDWSPDGRWLLYHRRDGLSPQPRASLLAAAIDRTAEPVAVVRCEGAIADQGRFSPDGRWVAFNCNESGRHEVYVAPFMHDGDRVRVSVDGGVQPIWRSDQRGLFFLGPDGHLMAASVESAASGLKAGTPRALFETQLAPNFQSEQFAVAPDGQRFLFLVPASGTSVTAGFS